MGDHLKRDGAVVVIVEGLLVLVVSMIIDLGDDVHRSGGLDHDLGDNVEDDGAALVIVEGLLVLVVSMIMIWVTMFIEAEGLIMIWVII